MSFRGRLTVFFLAIVVVPMIAVAVLVVKISDDSQEGKADARLDTGLNAAQVIYDRALSGAPEDVDRIANSPGIDKALAAPNTTFLGTQAEAEVKDPDIAALAFFAADGARLARAGVRDGIAASRRPVESGGKAVGAIEVAALSARSYVEEVSEITGDDAVIVADAGELAGTIEVQPGDLPVAGDAQTIDLGERSVRAASIALEGAPDGTRLVLVTSAEEGFVASEPLVAVILAAFFGLALIFILLLLRMLQRQVTTMLEAAQRIGTGDFSQDVPAEGNDEIAGLAREFNKMSGRLSEQMEQLRSQREELDESVKRIGEAFASGLDRTALLEIVIETALAACEAESGQIVLRGHDQVEAAAGTEPTGEIEEILRRAGVKAIERRELVEVAEGQTRAMAHPLQSAGDPNTALGTMAVARRGDPFTTAEREVLRYLIGQASVSVENIGLHERVAEQAVTDELTGLSNNRHFREWMVRETERMGRFGGELSLVMLDIDDFKQVNDTHGHVQGDRVLEAVGHALQLESRGVDEAARYGGEEFVLALPETPRVGAVEVAERVRQRLARTEVAGVDGAPPLKVTASLGVATMPVDAKGTESLVAAADAALYEAKRSGKNRVVAAGG